MITKGVASVPSPVRNLREWNEGLDHEKFVGGVAEEFARKYQVGGEIQVRFRSIRCQPKRDARELIAEEMYRE